jgi:hypothetical protein
LRLREIQPCDGWIRHQDALAEALGGSDILPVLAFVFTKRSGFVE